jgi:hypothetical protein
MSFRRSTSLLLTVIAACTVAPLAAACSVEQTLPPPYCFEEGSGLIVAQSVPTASQIPCFADLPTGWTFASVLVNEEQTVVRLDSDRVGDDAAVLRLEESCDTSGAVESPSGQPAAERYDLIERLQPGLRAEQFYVFPGGCVWWSFDFDSGTSATEAVAVDDALELVSRVALNEGLRETFIDEEI